VTFERYRKLDVLVNNAGVAPISLLDELRVDDWEEMIDVNLKGVLYGIAAALPVFRRQSFGHFVNVISTAEIQIIPTMAVYAGTKNAVRTITETLPGISVLHFHRTTVAASPVAPGCLRDSRPQAGHSARRCARWRTSRWRSCGSVDCRKTS
jgi:NADP-dependent 3-hydroxy acid dehydrogenase YdfG